MGLDQSYDLNISHLELVRLGLTDVSFLKGMHTLRSLSLRGNMISDLSPLVGMSLEVLRISENQVSDLSPQRECLFII